MVELALDPPGGPARWTTMLLVPRAVAGRVELFRG